ncbi:MAG: DUF5110 domain-containing protein [Clostridia bacterium]|nr:DUF5110 domain-containing protein [Clostridia bacterium]
MNGWTWVSESEERRLAAGAVKAVEADGKQALVGFERGKARVLPYGEGIMRLTLTQKDFLNLESLAVVKPMEGNICVEGGNGVSLIQSGGLSVKLTENESGLQILNHLGQELLSLKTPFYKTRTCLGFQANVPDEAKFYGLGEKTGFLDKRGRSYTMWNTDDPLHTPDKDPLYKSIPFLIYKDERKVFGLFLDSIAMSTFDLGFQNRDAIELTVQDDEMDLHLIDGDSIKEVISRYTSLTGTMKLPPMWSLGYQQCRWSYQPEERVEKLASDFREHDMPCDVIYLDIDYMDDFRVFTFNSDRFPDPLKMSEHLMEKGIRLVTIIDPGVKKDSDYKVYTEGAKNGYFCKLPDGNIYHGKVWPGVSAFPDFSQLEARKWWGRQHAALFNSGISGIWNDMNEPSDFSVETYGDRKLACVPNEVMMDFDGKPRSFAKTHNAYGFLMAMATLEGFKALKPKERPFIVTRAAYAGIQRHSAVWTGDNHSWWEHLASSIPMHMNIGLSGVPFVGGDVGGFQGECEPELFARWVQLGAFTPFFRAHSVIHTRDHEPWAFGEEVEKASREAIRLRYSLLPYLYSEMKKASDTGLPVMRPLVLEFENDAKTHHINDQFMFGQSILVAPVTRRHDRQRLVYLPEGGWYDYYTKSYYKGGQTIIADAPLDKIPIFIREGAVIPFAEPQNSTQFMDFGKLRLEVYAGANGLFELYEDDGISFDYLEGKFNLTRLTLSQQENGCELSIECLNNGYEEGCKSFELTVFGLEKPFKQNVDRTCREVFIPR